jgi:hypothetical protein
MRWTREAVLVTVLSAGVLATGDAVHAQTRAPVGCQADFATADRNRDGRLDREEFHQRTVEQFFLVDRSRRGYLLVAEVVGITDETFRKTDVNRDGRLSLQEFVNARYVDFLAADRNQDGSLSFEEVRLYSRC